MTGKSLGDPRLQPAAADREQALRIFLPGDLSEHRRKEVSSGAGSTTLPFGRHAAQGTRNAGSPGGAWHDPPGQNQAALDPILQLLENWAAAVQNPQGVIQPWLLPRPHLTPRLGTPSPARPPSRVPNLRKNPPLGPAARSQPTLCTLWARPLGSCVQEQPSPSARLGVSCSLQ